MNKTSSISLCLGVYKPLGIVIQLSVAISLQMLITRLIAARKPIQGLQRNKICLCMVITSGATNSLL